MLNLTTIRQPSERIKRRARLMWITKVDSNDRLIRFRITPHGGQFHHKSKSKRLVTIDVEQGTALCVDYHSGALCQANADHVIETGEAKTATLCSHVYAALKRLKVFEQPETQAA